MYQIKGMSYMTCVVCIHNYRN